VNKLTTSFLPLLDDQLFLLYWFFFTRLALVPNASVGCAPMCWACIQNAQAQELTTSDVYVSLTPRRYSGIGMEEQFGILV